MADLDKALFEAWESGNDKARAEAWERLWQTLYSWAVRFCRGFCQDDQTAEEWATDAFEAVLQEITVKVQRGETDWRRSESFLSYVKDRLKSRCRDQIRRATRRNQRLVSASAPTEDDEEVVSLLDLLPSDEKSPEEAALSGIQVRAVLRSVAVVREICHGRAALTELLDKMDEHLRRCIVSQAAPAAKGATLTLDQLLDVAASASLEQVDIDLSEFYRSAMAELQITRNVLDQRLKQIRMILRNLQMLTPLLGECAPFLALLGYRSDAPPQVALTKEEVAETLQQVAAASQVCREMPAMAGLFAGILEYLRTCLSRSAPPEVDAGKLSLDQLVVAVPFDRLSIDRAQLASSLIASLRIDRETLDQRMEWIRALLG